MGFGRWLAEIKVKLQRYIAINVVANLFISRVSHVITEASMQQGRNEEEELHPCMSLRTHVSELVHLA